MTYLEIINSVTLNKTDKARALFALGYTRRQVADTVLNGNYGFAQNIFVKYVEQRVASSLPSAAFTFVFNRTFGVEIEAYGATREAVANAIRREGLDVYSENYNHTTRNYWKVITDGSISGTNGFEVVSPVLAGEDGLAQLEKVCRALKSVNAKINKSCGLHVHLGAGDLTVKNWKTLYENYANLEVKIDDFMPESRRANNNGYCKSMISAVRNADLRNCQTLNAIQSKVTGGSRYVKLNTTSFARHGTVEFRHHSGTIEFDKISNWILFTARLVEYTKLVEPKILTTFAAPKYKLITHKERLPSHDSESSRSKNLIK
jgi:Putative amidoligase enzyme